MTLTRNGEMEITKDQQAILFKHEKEEYTKQKESRYIPIYDYNEPIKTGFLFTVFVFVFVLVLLSYLI